jgi:uncharacterized protein (DUF58 family)
MIPIGAALWSPATTPAEADRSRRFLRPRGFAAALVVLAVVGALLSFPTDSVPQFVVALALLTAVVLDGAVARRAMRDGELRFDAAPLVTTSEPLPCTVRAEGFGRPVVVTPAVRPAVQHFLIDDEQPGLVVLAPRRRGLVHSLLVDVVCTGPIGLVQCGRRERIALRSAVTVGPTPLPHDARWPRPRATHFGTSATTPVGDELYRSVRPYVRGDSRRRVHWKASAHRGGLMVKETDGTGLVVLRIVVQLPGPSAAAEIALGRAAHLAAESIARGWVTELVTVQPRVVPVAPAPRLGSPFAPPPLEMVAASVPTAPVARVVGSARAAVATLATASYGPAPVTPARGPTVVVTPEGDHWR